MIIRACITYRNATYLGKQKSETTLGAFFSSLLIVTAFIGVAGTLTMDARDVMLPIPLLPDKWLLWQLYRMFVYSLPIWSDF